MEEKLKQLKVRIDDLFDRLDIEGKKKTLHLLMRRTEKPDFWHDQDEARKTLQEISRLRDEIETTEKLSKSIENAIALSSDTNKKNEILKETEKIEEKLAELELATFFSGPYDGGNAIVSIYAGQGGVEAMDWAEILQRMYMRYSERRGWEVEIVDKTPGEEAGVKSITLIVMGAYAYGYLRGETGTHRLVRQSPFNADKLRQTSFAQVSVLPQITEPTDVKIREDDLEWQFFRASSQGGQNVQKVSTAVRLRHKPTGITVSAQSERYQEQNRKIALMLLRSKLWQREKDMQEKEKRRLKGKYQPASWGTQIRSYVLHPYKMVKDLRTEVTTSNVQKVLDGEIDDFIKAETKLLNS